MSNMYFSSKGRIGSQDFMKAGVILIAIGAGISVLKLLIPILGLITPFIFLAMLFPWIFIWIKRLHNGNKSGEMVVAYVALYIALYVILTLVALSMFGDSTIWDAAMAYANQEISMEEYMSAIEGASGSLTLPSLIAGVIASFLTLVIGDKATPNDPDDNQFGPA